MCKLVIFAAVFLIVSVGLGTSSKTGQTKDVGECKIGGKYTLDNVKDCMKEHTYKETDINGLEISCCALFWRYTCEIKQIDDKCPDGTDAEKASKKEAKDIQEAFIADLEKETTNDGQFCKGTDTKEAKCGCAALLSNMSLMLALFFLVKYLNK